MENESGTLNSSGGSSNPMDSGDTISTIFEAPKEAETEKPASEAGGAEGSVKEKEEEGVKEKEAETKKVEKEVSKEDDEKGPVPYSRFKESRDQVKKIISEHAQETSALRQKLEELEERISKPQQKEEPAKKLPFKDLTAMTPEQARDWMDSDPIGYAANQAAQIHHEIMNAISEMKKEDEKKVSQQNFQKSYEETVNHFAENNDGFSDMMKDGSIKKFMKTNPGFDVFSSYYALTAETRQANMEKEIAAAKADAEKKVREEYEKNTKAKREIRTIGAGPGSQSIPDPEKIDTKGKGLIGAIAERLSLSRSKAA